MFSPKMYYIAFSQFSARDNNNSSVGDTTLCFKFSIDAEATDVKPMLLTENLALKAPN